MDSRRPDSPPPNLASPFGAPILRLEETGSTMDDARALAAEGGLPGSLVLAEHQREGRGRTRGRRWEGERGSSLLATLIAPPAWRGLPALSLRVGLALALACEDFCRVRGLGLPTLGLKWPNDLMGGDRKLGGILCEVGPRALLVGFGINIAQRGFSGELAAKATSLALLAGAEDGAAGGLGGGAARDALAEAALARLAGIGAEGDWKAAVEARLWRRGERVDLATGLPDRGERFEARLLGLGPEGALLVEDGEGRPLALHSAELLLEPRVDRSAADPLS